MPVKTLSAQELENKFRLAVSWRNAQLDFLGLPSFTEEKPIPLEDIYVAVRFSWESRGDKSLYLADALKQHRHLVVLGGPGCGKSTLIQMMAYSFGRTQPTPLAKMLGTRIPVPIVLRDYRVSGWSEPEDMLRDFIATLDSEIRDAVSVDWLLQVLTEGRGALLIDGIDEVGSAEHRGRLRDRIVLPLLKRSIGSLAVLTSRIVGYEEAPFDTGQRIEPARVESGLAGDPPRSRSPQAALGGSEFIHSTHADVIREQPSPEGSDVRLSSDFGATGRAYLLPFGEDQIGEYIRRWYDAREPRAARRKEREESLVRGVLSSPRLSDLASTPALLSLMALVHRATGRLPEERLSVYNKIVEAYLETIQLYRHLPGFSASLEQMKRWLSSVGYEMQCLREEDGGIEANSDKVLEWLREEGCGETAKGFLEYVLRRSGLLVPAGKESLRFMHLSLQEYFAAFHMRGWIREFDLLIDQCSSRIASSTWHETLEFVFEMLAEFPGAAEDLARNISKRTSGTESERGAAEFFVRMQEGVATDLGSARIDVIDLVLGALYRGLSLRSSRSVLDFLDRNEVNVPAWLKDREETLSKEDPVAAAKGLTGFGRLYRNQGRYQEAEPLVKRALAIYEKALGSDHPNAASSLNNLAVLYVSQGRYEEAEPLHRGALAIYEKALGPDHPDTASSLNNLAGLYNSQGRYEEAEPLYRRALAIREKALGPDHPDTASSLNNLATVYDSQGRYEEAEPLYRRALAIREKVLGPDHPDTASSLNNLAVLYRHHGRYDQAERLYRRALAIHEKALGPDHPYTATSLNNLAVLYRSQGRHEEAEQALERFTNNAVSYTGLAETLRAQNKMEEAEAVYRQALERFPNNAVSYTGLAETLRAQNKMEEAEAVYRQALELFPNNAVSYAGLAETLRAQNKLEEAEAVYRQALELFPNNAVSYTGLAETLRAQNKLEEAEAVHRQALELFPNNAVSHTGLAETLRAQNKLEEAQAVYRQALELFPNNAVSHTGLAETLRAQNKLEEAQAVYRQALELFPYEAVSYSGLGQTLRAQNKLEEAEAVYRQALELFPYEAVSYSGLGQTLRAQNKLEGAEAVYRKALKRFPQRADMRTGLEKVRSLLASTAPPLGKKP